VVLDENNLIRYYGRENRDFIKDGFGVKIPLKSVKSIYKPLNKFVQHIEYFPMKCKPGLVALLFITDTEHDNGLITNKALIDKYAVIIESINIHQDNKLEPFEKQHFLISRIILINSDFPSTVKGNPSRFKIQSRYADTIEKAVGLLSNDAAIKEIKTFSGIKNSFTKYHNSFLGHMMSALLMDYDYHRGKKDSLYTDTNGKETEIIDFTGGFGSNLLGHNNQHLKKVVNSFLQKDQVSIADQGSIQKSAGKLAENLNSIVGNITGHSYNVLFGSTGSEAVEIALHHALFDWRKKIKDLEKSSFSDTDQKQLIY